jgi:hypothetical protein
MQQLKRMMCVLYTSVSISFVTLGISLYTLNEEKKIKNYKRKIFYW